MRTLAAQPDLFGEIESAELRSAELDADVHRQSVEFLTSPWSGLLAWWIDPERSESERQLDHGECKASYRRGRMGEPEWPGWAWSAWRDGLHFERGDEWSQSGGWRRRPTHVIPWSSLHQLRDAHPDELDELRRLSRGRGTPHSLGWRWYSMPSILNPWGCHHSYFESEREDDYYAGDTFDDVPRPGGFRDRIKAWGIVVDLARKLGPGVRP